MIINKTIILPIILVTFLLSNIDAYAGQQYTCPMHPHYVSDKFGSCPICGMDLVPIENEDESEDKSQDQPSADNKYPTISISPEIIQTIGVKTVEVQESEFAKSIKTFGNIDINERSTYDISSRIEGWVEELNIKAVGDKVEKGDLLYKIYSPDLISDQKDYINALRNGNRARIRSIEKHLTFLGVQSKTLKQIKQYRKSLDKVPFFSEVQGIVHHINVKQGSYIKTGMKIVDLQDYSSVWINAEIFGNDIKLLDKESIATIYVPSINKKYDAKIDYIHPLIDKDTKTNQVRLVLDNKEGLLKPGDFANIEFKTQNKKRLIIPAYAILKTTESNHVILALNNGKFVKRDVEIGISNNDKTEIIKGLKVGDKIVVSSQFLIDSESSLKEALSKINEKNDNKNKDFTQ